MSFDVLREKARRVKREKRDAPAPLRNAARAILDESNSEDKRLRNAHGYVQHYVYHSDDENDPLNQDDYLKVFYEMIYEMYED
jgi:hypothetical protein